MTSTVFYSLWPCFAFSASDEGQGSSRVVRQWRRLASCRWNHQGLTVLITRREHCLLVFESLFIIHLVIAGFDRGSDDREGVVLCSRSQQWEGFCVHLSRRHHSSLDVSRISCCQGIRKCLTCFLIQYACRATFVCVVRTCMYTCMSLLNVKRIHDFVLPP